MIKMTYQPNFAFLNNFVMVTLVHIVFLYSAGYAQFQWSTTRDGSSNGRIRLEKSELHVYDQITFLDIEEDAWLRTEGGVGSGDPGTLEINGRFFLPHGSFIIGVLIWDGDEILKGKIKSAEDARSEYENVVQREIPRERHNTIL